MNDAATMLGYQYASGKFVEDKTINPKKSTEAEFTALEEDVKAKLDNGVLTLCIKKVDEKEEPKAKYIAIE